MNLKNKSSNPSKNKQPSQKESHSRITNKKHLIYFILLATIHVALYASLRVFELDYALHVSIASAIVFFFLIKNNKLNEDKLKMETLMRNINEAQDMISMHTYNRFVFKSHPDISPVNITKFEQDDIKEIIKSPITLVTSSSICFILFLSEITTERKEPMEILIGGFTTLIGSFFLSLVLFGIYLNWSKK